MEWVSVVDEWTEKSMKEKDCQNTAMKCLTSTLISDYYMYIKLFTHVEQK